MLVSSVSHSRDVNDRCGTKRIDLYVICINILVFFFLYNIYLCLPGLGPKPASRSQPIGLAGRSAQGFLQRALQVVSLQRCSDRPPVEKRKVGASGAWLEGFFAKLIKRVGSRKGEIGTVFPVRRYCM